MDGGNTESQTKRPRFKFSRREFLRLGPPVVAGLVVGLKGLEQTFYKSLSLGINDSHTNDVLTASALKISETAPNSENSNFRSMTNIIREGISQYLQSGKSVFFEKSPSYKDSGYYADKINETTSNLLTIKTPNEVLDHLTGSFSVEAQEAFNQSSSLATGYDLLFVPGSGFLSRFRRSHPEYHYVEGTFTGSVERYNKMDREGSRQLKELRLWIEGQSKKKGGPISSSQILTYFLEKNEGDISQSIFDTGIFLKFAARTDSETGEYSATMDNVSWFKQNILDEFQGPSYHSIDGEEAINLIGKPYHSWNLAAFLYFFPAEIVRLGGIQRQLDNFSQQGLAKTRADLQTLNDLREVEQLLSTYSIQK